MQADNEIFIGMLSAYVNKQQIVLDEEINWESVYHLASIHSVQGIIAAVVSNNELCILDEINKNLQKDFYSTLMHSVKQEKEAENLLNILNKACIPHIMTKGYVVKNYYPDKELRTMGDIDILVSEESFEKAKELLKENDYTITDTYFNEVSFDKNNVHFEIHKSLLDEDLGNSYDYGKYFEQLCKKAVKVKDHTHELNIDDHLIYLIAHIGKHFYNEGCGIRMIMDIAVYVNRFTYKLNWDYLWNEFEKIRLKKFAENIFFICNKWFNTEIYVPNMNADLYKEIESYILEAGTFGFYERNSGVKLLRKSYGSGKQGNVMAWFFPGDKDMRELSEWYKDKPTLLLPVAWIKRWIDSFRTKKWSAVSKALGTVKGRDTAEKQYVMLKELGIYQNDNKLNI